MTHRSPLVTLIGLVAAFAIMFGVNLAGSAPPGRAADPGPGAVATTAEPSPGPTSAAAGPTPTDPPPPSATPSPAAEPFPDEVVYAGRTEDDSLAVAVAVRGEQAAAYLCDGDSVESWLRGPVKGATVALQNKDGSNEVTAELVDGRLVGTITLADQDEELAFSLAEAEKPAGLYRARGAKTTIGWIVLPDGSQVGVQTTGEESVPAPELDPANPEVDVDGEALSGEPVTGDQDV